MKQKIWGMLLFVLTVLTCMLAVYVYVDRDKTAPVISVAEVTMHYSLTTQDSELLTLVKAKDNSDKDVSKRLIVTGKQLSANGKTVSVTYAASDRYGNTGFATANLPVQPDTSLDELKKVLEQGRAGAEQKQPDQTGEVNKSDKTASEKAGSEKSTSEKTASEKTVSEKANSEKTDSKPVTELTADGVEQTSKAGEGLPQMTLKSTVVKLPKGGDVNLLSFVKTVSDDTDSESELFANIHIDPMHVDTNEPGTHELSFTVKDSSGNYSNHLVLKLIVQ